MFPFRSSSAQATVLAVAAMLLSSAGFSQAIHTFVSGVGDDVNPCSRNAPCKTFAGAMSKTAPNGEINVIDPGGFGAVTITKSITIDGRGVHSSISATGGISGIIVNAGANDKVIIRNLTINGFGSGKYGVRFIAGGSVTLDHVIINGETDNGVDATVAQNCQLNLSDVAITNCLLSGIQTQTSAGNIFLNLDGVRINACGTGLNASNGSRVGIQNSDFSSNTNGMIIQSPSIFAKAQLDNCYITNTVTAIHCGPGSPNTKLSDCTIANNAVGLEVSGSGSFQSAGNNVITGNTNNGVVPTVFGLE
jgi:hypothetical protein